MDIVISPSSGKPIYEQLEEQIKNLILARKLKPGDPLPSMRDLAKDLNISLITTKRAYEDLESQGFIVSMVGKGSFVSDANMEFLSEYKYQEIESLLRKVVEQSKLCDVNFDEIVEILRIIYEEGRDERLDNDIRAGEDLRRVLVGPLGSRNT